ncbi:MAG: preprotein translocase subunit YajC [Alphaproteobacteria bacterium]|uniref:preprotein translocase subunit YajC n=1 Tax=Hyphomonas sp. TaxID=87 RepID=UPI001D5A80DC|nr:preprotein translocase subunit YajC [Alphaproteobacteria bacterium]MBU2083407.1 preprotein translocase subunit YajC [Alphaproteobacteria bacterium]MBU2143628.1 preprotein translocase subunit YajC [Alphaproteobacteria bacterium]MBU2195971.1 preprotein translocase subunit YajC [Alphaproteobacteria bacterium]
MLNKFAAAAIVFMGLSLPALAQAAPPAAGPGILTQVMFFLPLILIFYFLLIRPQQQRAKKHKLMIEAVKRGDTVITSGGLIGKVIKVGDTEVSLELAENVRVRVIKAMVVDVKGKNEPVAAND